MTVTSPGTTAATFCATLVDEWVAAGLTAAMVAPGSRSTPMALALAAHPALAVHVFHDERAAAFAALGHGSVTGRAAALLCSSGTAATHFHAAVVEADLSDVPLLVLTADRPAELRDVGAAQTIDQTHLYGRSVRWFHDPGVPSAEAAHGWRSLARRAWRATCVPRPGPVHLNLPFREPLVGEPGPLPPGAPLPGSDVVAVHSEVDGVAAYLDRQRGVIVAGRGAREAAAGLGALAEALGWPLLADARSGCRHLPAAVCHADALLRHPGFARDHTPEVVLHVGEPWASRVVNEWLHASGALHVHVGSSPRPLDPGLVVGRWVTAPVADVVGALAGVRGAAGTTWATRWRHAEAAARAALDAALPAPPDAAGAHDAGHGLGEPAIARLVVDTLGALAPARLVVASSMPVRDVEWYTRPAEHLDVLSNRGANGIDGTIATAIGAALADPVVPTGVLLGDVAFLHDSSALTALARRDADVRIVVVDNDGGGIFSFLPQASALPKDTFELLYGTPHGTDLVALARAHDLPARGVTSAVDLVAALRERGPHVVVVRTDRSRNVHVHAELHAAVAAALGGTGR